MDLKNTPQIEALLLEYSSRLRAIAEGAQRDAEQTAAHYREQLDAALALMANGRGTLNELITSSTVAIVDVVTFHGEGAPYQTEESLFFQRTGYHQRINLGELPRKENRFRLLLFLTPVSKEGDA